MIDYAQLRAEIDSDPAGRGYAAMVANGNDVGLAALLNEQGVSAVDRVYITAPELQGALDATEFVAFNAAFLARWQAILMVTREALPVNTGGLKQQLLAMFPNQAGTANSRANLIALQTKQGSRVEALFGDGAVVSTDDIVKAKAL